MILSRRAAEVRDRLPLARLTEWVGMQERADWHAEELEAEYGPLIRDDSFDDRFPPGEAD